MELKTFVTQSIIQISEGIKDAQNAETGAIVAPRINFTDKGKPRLAGGMITFAPQMISFDVAVYVVESDNDKAGGKIGVSFLGVGRETSSTKENSSISHIRFEIPVVWPEGKKQ